VITSFELELLIDGWKEGEERRDIKKKKITPRRSRISKGLSRAMIESWETPRG